MAPGVVAVKEMYQLNPEIQTAKKICIFGTGINAVCTFARLAEKSIYVDFFADRSPQCEKIKVLLNRPVINEDDLAELKCVVIIASTAWKEIADRLQRKNIHNIYIAPTMSDRKKQVIADENYLLSVGETGFSSNIVYVCCPRGLGDTLYVAALAKGYKEAHPEIEKLCFITKEKHRGLVSLFQGVDETIISDEIVAILYQYSVSNKIWRKQNYIYGHFTIDWLSRYDLGLYKGNMVSFYKKYIMHLPEACELEYPRFHDILKNAGDVTDSVNKNTVVLMPYAESSEMLPECFWDHLGNSLLRLGYEVYTNVKDGSEKVISGTNRISESVEVMAQLCEKSLAVISMRSGICDLLAFTDAVLLIVNTEEVHLKFWNVKSIADRENIFNLNFFQNRDARELEKDILRIVEKVRERE